MSKTEEPRSQGRDPAGPAPAVGAPSDSSPAKDGPVSLRDLVRSRTSAIVLVVVGMAFVAGAAQLPLGSLRDPGPGLWPMAVGVLVAILGAASGLQGDRSMPAFETPRSEFAWAALAFAELIGFVLAFWFLGYFGATFLVVLGMGLTFSKVSWRRLLVIALLFGAAMHAFFSYVLVLPPPHYLF